MVQGRGTVTAWTTEPGNPMRSAFARWGALASLLLAMDPGGIGAQPLRRPVGGAVGGPFAAWPGVPADSVHTSFPLGARLLTATGAAVIGAGLGFFASQLARGDWQDGPGGRKIDRPLWAAIGGGVGFAIGFRFPLGRMGVPAERSALPSGRDRLGADEIQSAKVVTGYEAVQLLRPEWLVLRGQQTLRPPPDGDFSDGGPQLRVYVDSNLLGGIDALRTIHAQDIGAVYFLDAGEATLRWGAGHPQGAILVILAG